MPLLWSILCTRPSSSYSCNTYYDPASSAGLVCVAIAVILIRYPGVARALLMLDTTSQEQPTGQSENAENVGELRHNLAEKIDDIK